MADVATSLGWSATVCFARGAAAALAPRNKLLALSWIGALQEAGEFEAAEQALDDLRAKYSHDGDVAAARRALGVARTMQEGRWNTSGSFRDKLRD